MSNGDIPDQNDRNEPPSWRRIVANLVDAYGEARRAKTYKKPRDWPTIWTAGATVVIAIFTAVAVGVGVAQWQIQSGTLAEMQAEQRPWLSVDVVPTQFTVVRDVPPNIIYEIKGINVGKSPARDVTYTWFSHIPTGPEEGSFADLAFKNCSRSPMTGFAPIVMPGEAYTQRQWIGFTNRDLQKAWGQPNEKGRKTFNAIIVVCAAFRMASEKEAHLLAVVTQIEQLSADKPVTFNVLGKYGD